MASTYSTNLALELIGAGEQAGTWGTTTNTNLGTLIEQAISGYGTYSCTGGTDTLVMTPGATATARNIYIQLNGTGGGTVVVPTPPKLYFIFNNTSTAITVKTSAGTGISVPAAAKMVLMCDGTNVVVAENYLLNATLASPTLTGTPLAPTATVGTNTTQIATTAFVQAAAVTLNAIYPVGSIYTSTVSTNPATLFGVGTWVAFGAGRVMLGNGGGFTAGATGGSADAVVVSHTHTASTAITDPGHFHVVNPTNSGTDSGPDETLHNSRGSTNPLTSTTSTTGITAATTITSAGVSGTNANLPPYVVVYMWNRTA